MNVHPLQVESLAQRSWQLDASPVKLSPGELAILLPRLSFPGSGAAHSELGGLGLGVGPEHSPLQKPEVYVFHCWSASGAEQSKFESLSQHCFVSEFVAFMNVHPLQVESLAQRSWRLDASPVKLSRGELAILLPWLSFPGSGAAHSELGGLGLGVGPEHSPLQKPEVYVFHCWSASGYSFTLLICFSVSSGLTAGIVSL